MRQFRILVSAAAAMIAVGAMTLATSSANAATSQRINLRVLVVSDGGSPVEAIRAQLAAEGVPTTVVELNKAGRPTINAAYLSDTVDSIPRAKFQGVVLPNENPFTNAAEMAALIAFEKTFGIRQIDAYAWASPAVGLNYATYSGPVDAVQATATATGLAGAFKYLRGPVPFDDNSPTVAESYAFLGTPLNAEFVPYITARAPGATTDGVLAGVYTHDGRSELVMTFAYNLGQQQFRMLGHGLISWLTNGVHFGYSRNYFALHVDDVFLPDARWNSTAHCTPGEDCPAGTPATADIRMTAADVTYAVDWQRRRGFTMDMMFNGGGSAQAVTANGSDPLTTAALANKAAFRWVNHTYEHPFLGCIQDYTVSPWRCTTANGVVQYTTRSDIQYQITQNKTWASANGLPIQANELVTGEHSGFFITPQQPVDNPNLGPAFTATGIAWAGSDNSRDPAQRKVGSARTVPRHPMNIFFNVAKFSEEIAEYNWIYSSRTQGGSGICDDNPATTTCIAPLDPVTGFQSYIVPLETKIALSHIGGNDVRPHYVHQSNITEDRVIYPLLDSIFDQYANLYAANSPMVNLRMSAIGAQLARETTWRTAVANGTVTAYLQDGKVVVSGPTGVEIPLTMPDTTKKQTLLGGTTAFGTLYAGERSAYQKLSAVQPTLTLVLPAGATV